MYYECEDSLALSKEDIPESFSLNNDIYTLHSSFIESYFISLQVFSTHLYLMTSFVCKSNLHVKDKIGFTTLINYLLYLIVSILL